MYVVLIWNGYSEKWDILEQGDKERCLDTYNRHLLYYRTAVRMKMVEMV
jgi:hypothetical protein